MEDGKSSRRRGKALECAILDAAWAELTERGYSRLTLEAVAKRARTSRPVLHRRWERRSDLAAAAMMHNIAQNPISVPDLGNVREELFLLLRSLADRGTPMAIRLMLEMREDLSREGESIATLRFQITAGGVMEEILQRGVDRGEIDPEKLTPRIVSLPKDLLRHEAIMTNQPVSDSVIKEVLDEVFLPLVSPTCSGR